MMINLFADQNHVTGIHDVGSIVRFQQYTPFMKCMKLQHSVIVNWCYITVTDRFETAVEKDLKTNITHLYDCFIQFMFVLKFFI